jgi:hypothetical protein
LLSDLDSRRICLNSSTRVILAPAIIDPDWSSIEPLNFARPELVCAKAGSTRNNRFVSRRTEAGNKCSQIIDSAGCWRASNFCSGILENRFIWGIQREHRGRVNLGLANGLQGGHTLYV